MPRISEFFGIVIYMYWFDNKRHKKPHIHAVYQNNEAVFDLEGNCLSGDIGNRALRLIQDFISERQSELQLAWKKAIVGEEVPWVKPIL